MHQIFGATLRNLAGTWVGSYYGRIRQQGTRTKKISTSRCVCAHTARTKLHKQVVLTYR
jgi:hypothetical protein